jgi:glycosyltransferase involved in cell wall biosynthesis
LPVVANDVGGWSRLIEDEEVGYLTSADPRDFAETVSSMVGDTQYMRMCSRNGLEIVQRKYSWNASANKLLNVYGALLN